MLITITNICQLYSEFYVFVYCLPFISVFRFLVYSFLKVILTCICQGAFSLGYVEDLQRWF